MKRITLKSLEMRSFKGAENRRINFNETTTICGDNGTGKSTIMDAFLWCLWGTNSADATTTSFGIRPCNKDGNIRLEEDPEVTAWLEITDDQTGETAELTLCRKWTGVWRVKRGESEKTFTKNQGEYKINDVPVKESEYREKVASLMPLSVFKTVTNPYYFNRLPWQDRRELLMQICGDITNEDIAAKREEFAELLARLNGTKVEERRKELLAKCARLTKDIEQLPIRIEEAVHNMPIEPDYKELEAKKTDLENQMLDIDTQLFDIGQQAEKDKATAEAIRAKLAQQASAVQNAQEQAYKSAAAANTKRNMAEQALAEAKEERLKTESQYKFQIQDHEYRIKQEESDIARCAEERDRLLSEWYGIDKQEFRNAETLICPVYGRPCPDSATCQEYAEGWTEARNSFFKHKMAQQQEITEKGQKVNSRKERHEQQLAQAKADLEALKAEQQQSLSQLDQRIRQAQQNLDAMGPRANAPIIRGEDLQQWRDLENEIQELRTQIGQSESEATMAEHRQRKAKLGADLDEVKRKLGFKEVIESMKKRKKELEAKQQILLEERAKWQRELDIIDKMERAKTTEAERRINGHFKLVKFQMTEQVMTTGEEKPCCNCLVDGVKWEDANKASQISAGIDIINALSEYYQTAAPIFIDNAESANHLIGAVGQTVLLKVTMDKELVIS